MKLHLCLLLLASASAAMAQNSQSNPAVRVCRNLSEECTDGAGALTEGEKKKLAELMSTVVAGATEQAVSAKYRLKVGSRVPGAQAYGQPEGTLISRATWWANENESSPFSPHVDVYFLNDRAAWFKWWFNEMQKNVTVVLVTE
jgi:hypothetical protein